jgi:hypothetical protein
MINELFICEILPILGQLTIFLVSFSFTVYRVYRVGISTKTILCSLIFIILTVIVNVFFMKEFNQMVTDSYRLLEVQNGY